MSDFVEHAQTAAVEAADPTKHVNYNLGMVLGVDDFRQEFAYHHGRDKWLARDAIGYGTLSGLRVTLERTGSSVKLVVAPGAALNPEGELIRICKAQCAELDKWVAAEQNAPAVAEAAGSPPGLLRLYVVLCYRDCETDPVLIPGEPCRDESEITKPSRLQDGFRLELRTKPPEQTEEDAIRDFVHWVRENFELVHTPVGGVTADEFIDMLREPSPSPLEPLRVEGDLCELAAAAFRFWVTERRPASRPKTLTSCCDSLVEGPRSAGDCLLLAEVSLAVSETVSGVWQIDDLDAVTLDESARPIVTHLRFLQEWAACGLSMLALPEPPVFSPPEPPEPPEPPIFSPPLPEPIVLAGDVTGPEDNTVVERLRGRMIATAATNPPTDGILIFRSQQWRPVDIESIAVTHPNVGPFQIVAAGIARGDGNSRFPVYNRLTIIDVGSGTFVFTFNGYRNPEATDPPKHTYIVKGFPVIKDPMPFDLMVMGFEDQGIRMGILRRSQQMPIQEIRGAEFMLEVSFFPG